MPKKNPDKKKKDKPTGKVETAPNVAEGTAPEAVAADVPITPADVTARQPVGTVLGTISTTPVRTTGVPIGIFQLPPFLNTSPSIGSLSPPGVQVGSGDTALTILGSNFGTGSTVLWNGTALPGATIISSTQINVTIPAADLAEAGTPNVVVQNPAPNASTAPVSSNSVQFTVMPSWQNIQQQLNSVQPPLPAYVNTYVQLLTMQNTAQSTQIQTDATNYNNLNTQYQTAQATVAQQAAQISSLQSQLATTTFQTASPLDVASSFKNVVDQIQQAAQSAGGVQSTVTNMNVQIKSLLSVQGSTSTAPASASMIFPAPTALPDPAHLSTLSFTFGSIPNLKTAGGASAPPPAPAPAPALSGSTSSNPTPNNPAPAPTPSVAQPESITTSRVEVLSGPAVEVAPLIDSTVTSAAKPKATEAKKAGSKKG